MSEEQSITAKLEAQDKDLKAIKEGLLGKQKKEKGWKIRVPWKLQKKVLKADDKALVLYIGPNKGASWKTAVARDGLWKIEEDKDDKGYGYEEQAIFYLKIKKKQVPLIVLFSYRLLPVGGKAEEYRAMIVGGKAEEDAAEKLGIKKFGQQTIIRAIEQAELDKDVKKKGGMGWLIWVGVGIALIYVLSKFLKG